MSRIADGCALITVVIGLSVIAGWLLGIEQLKRILPTLVSMKFNTALGFVLAGTALGLRKQPSLRLGLGALVTLLGTLSLVENVTGWAPGLDQFFFQDTFLAPDRGFPPGRMSPTAALCFIFCGIALMGTSGGGGRRRSLQANSIRWTGVFRGIGYTAELLTLGVIAICGFSLIGYITGAEYLRHIFGFISMALHTAVAFVCLGVGILCAVDANIIRSLRFRGTSRALLFGFGLLMVMLAAIGIVDAVRLQILADDIAIQAGNARPRREATFALEGNVLRFVTYVHAAIDGDDLSKPVAISAAAAVDRYSAEYRMLANNDQQKDMASRFAAQWRDFFTYGQDLLKEGAKPGQDKLAQFAARRIKIEKLLIDEMRPDSISMFEKRREITLQALETTSNLPLIFVVLSIVIALMTAAGVSRVVLKQEQKLRKQAEDLQTRQDELNASNEELEEQSRTLQEAQSLLETEHAEVEQSNIQLARRSEELTRANTHKSEFLANMSHELRTPLNSVLILAKLLADNKGNTLTAEQVKYASTIYNSGNDLLKLINDILDLSRIEAGRAEVNAEPVDLDRVVEMLQHTLQPVAVDKNLRFDVIIDADAPSPITTDPLRLQQILRNLLSNAFKFTDAGGVTLHISAAPDDKIGFAVRDTGIGIPVSQQEVIFESFRQADGTTQRRFGGTGLGLTISKQLARRLGGDITVASAPGQGSIFTLLLPIHLVSVPRPSEDPSTGRGPASPYPVAARSWLRKATTENMVRSASVEDDREILGPVDKTLLVIEDDEAFACIVRDLAREQRFRCLVATTAGEGINLAERFFPSAIVLDIKLPDGSGLAVLEYLKRHPATLHIPVHVVSIEDHKQQALELGAIGYAIKPVMREEIVEVLRNLEQNLKQISRRILVVEDVDEQRESLVTLLSTASIEVISVATAGDALARLKEITFDAMVLDLNLPDMSGYELLDKLAASEAFSFPSVIVYTGHELSCAEEQRLRQNASSIIIKGARSPERLLDEVTLFLQQVEKNLRSEQQRILTEVRSRESALQGKTILVVEDDVRNVFALTSVLEPRGVKVQIARNGREALEALECSEREPSKKVDLVLMDIMMPEMDGITATREIRTRACWKKLPIIALTAKAMPDDREKCLQAGANDYIAKPLDVEKLISLITVWMPK